MSTPIQILNNAAEAVAWLRSRVQAVILAYDAGLVGPRRDAR